ncbi:YdeI/OmpD-associated family protein [Anoxynatronum buryatiense]|uniref:YdeI/OmpD-associated family protein n=1 Tax=Anoxynatronum buryatiense TaxID=489973 RepID=UPI0024B73B3D|nr:YdeI/OmpD-associated family protein [Anoxynatronum buryatiense]
MERVETVDTISFNAEICKINTWHILRIPANVSQQLPSRGMVMIQGTLNGFPFKIPLEPDGAGSHWFRTDHLLPNAAQLNVDDAVSLVIEPMKDWLEPEVPPDLQQAIRSGEVENQWNIITTKARWEWIRWIRFSNNPATRKKRIKTACAMLKTGKKRPCCFDQSRCTETAVSKNGILLSVSSNYAPLQKSIDCKKVFGICTFRVHE